MRTKAGVITDKNENIILDVDFIMYYNGRTMLFKYNTYLRCKREIIKKLCEPKYANKNIDYLNKYLFRKYGVIAVLRHTFTKGKYYEIITIQQYAKEIAKQGV